MAGSNLFSFLNFIKFRGHTNSGQASCCNMGGIDFVTPPEKHIMSEAQRYVWNSTPTTIFNS